MKTYRVILFTVINLLIYFHPAQAAGTPPPAATPVPAGQPFILLTGIPWGLVIVFIVAGFIITAIKKNNPNQVTVNCCMPLIDEKKMEIEKQKIAEEEANSTKS